MCGIEDLSRQRGFADFALEVFYIDFIEAGSSRKASLVLRTKDQLEMFQKSLCTHGWCNLSSHCPRVQQMRLMVLTGFLYLQMQ